MTERSLRTDAGDEFDETVSHSRLDEKSQYLSAMFHSTDLRQLSEEWDLRRVLWQRFWDRLFEEPQYSYPRWQAGEAPANPHRPGPESAAFLEPASLLWAHRNGWAINAPPMVAEFDGSYWARHRENIAVYRAARAESYTAALEHATEGSAFHEQTSQLQEVITRELAGVDAYWSGMVEDKPTTKDPKGLWYRRMRPNRSRSNWGVLRVYSFPFTAIFRFDDCEDIVVFSASPVCNRVRRFPKQGIEQMAEFVRVNQTPDVVAHRETRLKMRAMDDQTVTARVKHGARNVVTGTFNLVQSWERGESWKNPFTSEILSLAPGFDWTISTVPRLTKDGVRCVMLMCGEPEVYVHPDNFARKSERDAGGPGGRAAARAEAARAAAAAAAGDKAGGAADEDEDNDLDNAPRVLAKRALGLQSDTFDGDDAALLDLVDEDGNVDPVMLDYVRRLVLSHREALADTFEWKKRTLSYRFHIDVYMNDRQSRKQLSEHLVAGEHRHSVLAKDLVHGTAKRTYSHLLEDLYHRLAFFDGSLRAVCWYMFWHAIALNNHARNYNIMKRTTQKLLDPCEPGSPVTRVLSRPELEALLGKLKVYRPDGTGAVSNALLDQLYDKLAEVESVTLKTFSKKWVRNVSDAKRVMSHTQEEEDAAEERRRAAALEAEAAMERAAAAERNGSADAFRVCSRGGGDGDDGGACVTM